LGALFLISAHPSGRNQGWQEKDYASNPQQLLTVDEAGIGPLRGWPFETYQDSTVSVWAFLKPRLTTKKIYAFNKGVEIRGMNQRALTSEEEPTPPIILFGKHFHPEEEMEGVMFFRWIEERTANLIIINLNREVVAGDLTFQAISFHRVKTLEVYYLREEFPKLLKAFQVSPHRTEKLVIEDLKLLPGVNILSIVIPQGTENIKEITGKPDSRDVSLGLGDIRILNLHKVSSVGYPSPLRAWERVPYQTELDGRIKLLKAYFSREEGKEEILPLLSIPLNKSYPLEEFPYLDAELWVDDPEIGEIDLVLEIEVEKLASEKPTTPQNLTAIKKLNITYQSITEGVSKLDLPQLVKESLKYSPPFLSEENLRYRLKGINLIAHKKWGTDCLGDKRGQYNFYFGNISLYDERPTIGISSINLLESMMEKKQDIKAHTVEGDESLSLSLTEEELDILVNFSSRKEVAFSISPFQIDCQRESFLCYEYWVENPEDSSLYCLLGIDTDNDGLPERKVFPGLSFPLKGFLHTATQATLEVDFYESTAPPMFPYNTEKGSTGKFLVLKDNKPIQLTWDKWEMRSDRISIGEVDPQRIILTTRLNDLPQNHRYQLTFTPLEWETKDPRSGFSRLEVDLKQIINSSPCRIVSLDFVFVKHWKIGVPIPSLMKENFRQYRIRGIKFYHKSSGRVSELLEEEGKASLPLLQLDDTPLILPLADTVPRFSLPIAPASLSAKGGEPPLGEREIDSLKDGFWINLGAHRLEKGSHQIRPYQNNFFDILLLYLSPGANSQPFSIGEVKETLTSPEGRFWTPGEGRVKLSFQRLSATKYKVEGRAARSFWLVFNESFDPGWRAHLSLKEKPPKVRGEPSQKLSSDSWQKKELHQHIVVNGYANGWYVDIPSLPAPGKEEREFTIILEFRPQLLFTVGLVISGLTLVACITYLIMYSRKRRRADKP